MLAHAGSCLIMTENGSLVGTGMAITAGGNTTITGIATTTAIIVNMTANETTTVTSSGSPADSTLGLKDHNRYDSVTSRYWPELVHSGRSNPAKAE